VTTTQVAAGSAGPTADDIQPVKNETADRIATGTITALPFIALGIVCWQLRNS
jgi:stearoyl-CoA desaturase (Delta-9 desaturase)